MIYPGGEPCGYKPELENGYKIYHAGETGAVEKGFRLRV